MDKGSAGTLRGIAQRQLRRRRTAREFTAVPPPEPGPRRARVLGAGHRLCPYARASGDRSDLWRAAVPRRARRQGGAPARRRAGPGHAHRGRSRGQEPQARHARRRHRQPRRPGARHPLHERQHLCSPRRLRRGARAAARSRRAGRRERGARLHLCPARGSPLVRRAAVHERGFPLLLGGRRAQQGAQPGRGAGIHARRRQAPAGRGARRRARSATAGRSRTRASCRRWRSRAIRSSIARRII